MSVSLYFDHNVIRAVLFGLRSRGVDVIDTLEDGTSRLRDEALFERVQSFGRVLFTHDSDFLRISAARLGRGESHHGIIYVQQRKLSIGEMVENLEFLAKSYEPAELRNRVVHLPL